jgi:hypothetical protein
VLKIESTGGEGKARESTIHGKERFFFYSLLRESEVGCFGALGFEWFSYLVILSYSILIVDFSPDCLR